MTISYLLSCVGVALGASWALTAAVRRLALNAQMIDRPNERSSHSVPTPRGGGVAIVVSFVCVALLLWAEDAIPPTMGRALLLGGLLVAGIGFMDDRRHVPARWRLLVHGIAAAWVVWCMGSMPPLPVFGVSLELGWFSPILATVYLVWMVNLYNFMDGIDGIASLEGITVSVAGAVTWWLATGTPDWFVPVAFAACITGFLLWNFPTARIFMGDAGSGFIGIVLGIFSLTTAQATPHLFWCWIILFGIFMVDATTTLLRRMRRGERVEQAHRNHAYQYASRKHGSHKRVSMAVALINVLWLFPLAVLVATRHVDGAVGTIVAYAPLVWLAFRYKAGVRAAQEV